MSRIRSATWRRPLDVTNSNSSTVDDYTASEYRGMPVDVVEMRAVVEHGADVRTVCVFQSPRGIYNI
ncbi:MAG: hypothetical protein QXT13_13010 [Pyrobaculum sp.]